MKPGKTWRAVLDGSRDIRFDDVLRLAQAFGFVLKRVRGREPPYLDSPGHLARVAQPATGRRRQGQAVPAAAARPLVERHGLDLKE
jgi:hypothetical protein